MNFINNIPYKLGSFFDENSIDIEFRKEFNITKLYSSYRYSELYLFGKTFESVCYLWFTKNELVNIEYRFHKKYMKFFIDSINEELPKDNPLDKDPFVKEHQYYVFQDGIAIHIIELDSNFFLLRISNMPSLPKINK